MLNSKNKILNKKVYVVLVFLIFIFSINTVFAEDSNDDLEIDDEPPSGDINSISTINSSESGNSLVTTSNSKLIGDNIVMYYKDGTKYSVKLTNIGLDSISNKIVTFNIYGMYYNRTTDNNGVASLAINLLPGNYIITASYEGNKVNNNISILSTISGDNIKKIYKNDTQYYAAFFDCAGNPLANCDVSFNIYGQFYTRETDDKGIAKLNINLHPDKYIITAINPVNGEMLSNVVEVLGSINGDSIVKYYKNGTQYYATFLNSDGSTLNNTNVTFNIYGQFYTRETNDEGVARLNINLHPGEYIITAINPINGQMYSNYISVLSTLECQDMVAIYNNGSKYSVKVLDSKGNPSANVSVILNIGGIIYNITTDGEGIAYLIIDLPVGNYVITVVDLSNGLKISNILKVIANAYDTCSKAIKTYYDCYGASSDGLTIMSIGRPSVSSELSKYGYKFYKSVFIKKCPICGSAELYWGIFWAGNEYTNYGKFPATGNGEGGSAEGHIFCGHCDADFSAIDGKNHVASSSVYLTKVYDTVLSTKEDAYTLKNGLMIEGS